MNATQATIKAEAPETREVFTNVWNDFLQFIYEIKRAADERPDCQKDVTSLAVEKMLSEPTPRGNDGNTDRGTHDDRLTLFFAGFGAVPKKVALASSP